MRKARKPERKSEEGRKNEKRKGNYCTRVATVEGTKEMGLIVQARKNKEEYGRIEARYGERIHAIHLQRRCT
jgi:hypothetical protein